LHGENYFSAEEKAIQAKINYGNLMHEVFESITYADDIPRAVKKLVVSGRIPVSAAGELETRLKSLVSEPPASEWFRPDNTVLTEPEILLPAGAVRRPDRVLITGDKAVIIDFKTGKESPAYAEQIRGYRSLMLEMGFSSVKGYLWYIDRNIIVPA